MKKIAYLFFLFIIFPLCAIDNEHENNHPKKNGKREILACAEQARVCVNQHIDKVNELLNKLVEIKDLRLRERFQLFLTTSIPTKILTDIKTTFLVTAVTLLGDLIANEGLEKVEIIYDIYQELSYISTMMEEYNYYCQMSLNENRKDLPSYPRHDGFLYANYAVDHLTYADMLTSTIEFKMHSRIVSNYLTILRKQLMEELNDYGEMTMIYSGSVEELIENFDEIVCDCPQSDKSLYKKVLYELNEAYDYLLLAEDECDIISG